MTATEIGNRIALKYGANAGANWANLIGGMGVAAGGTNSAEKFLVSLMNLVCEAETQLPEAQAQNNFGYNIGEGGAYRATIRAGVSTEITVIA